DWNAAAVVPDAQAPIDVDANMEIVRVPGERFIGAVVDQFVNQMVQSLGAGVANVHARPLTNVRGVAEDLDVFRSIVRRPIEGRRLRVRGSIDNREGLVIHVGHPLSRVRARARGRVIADRARVPGWARYAYRSSLLFPDPRAEAQVVNRCASESAANCFKQLALMKVSQFLQHDSIPYQHFQHATTQAADAGL